MDGSESQNVVSELSSLTLLASSTVVNVVSGSGRPVESIVKPRQSAGLLITSGVFLFRNNGVARWRV